MSASLLRLPTVCKRVGLSRSYLWHLIKQGDFPRPCKPSGRVSAWDSRAIDAWIESRVQQPSREAA